MAASVDDSPSLKWIWYVVIVFGLLTAAAGVFFIAEPHETLKVFTVILGIFLVVDGVLAMLAAAFGRGESRGVLAVVGVISVLTGLVLIEEPFGALRIFVIIVGIWFVVVAVARFVFAFTLPSGRAGQIIIALLEAAAGVVILAWPHVGLSTLAIIIGIVLVLRGLLFVVAGWAGLRFESSAPADGAPAQA